MCVRVSCSRWCCMIRLMEWHAEKKEYELTNTTITTIIIWATTYSNREQIKNPAKKCWQKMETHKIDGCTSTVSSLFLPHHCQNNHCSTLPCMQNLQFLPLPHISPHTHAHPLAHSKLHTHPLASVPCHSFLVIILMFLLTAMVKHFEYSAACVERCLHGVPAFSPFVFTFFVCVHSALGTFFGHRIGYRSYVFASSSRTPHSLAHSVIV